MADEPFVWVTHPGLPGLESQKTTQRAFDQVWDALGWEIIPFGTDPEIPPAWLTEADLPTIYDRSNHIGLDNPATPAPSTEVDYDDITADITGIVVDSLNIDLISGLAVTIPNLSVPVYVTAELTVSSTTANATMAAVLCKTSPAPTTILDTVGKMGFVALSAAGSKGTTAPFVRLAPNTPCTLQVYLSGAGTATVHAQLYSRCFVRAVTV